MDLAVINYGCPRSGTTFVMQMLQRGRGYFTWRLSDKTYLHPCVSATGLKQLHHAITADGRRRALFVRTVRHPLETARSLWALRCWELGEPPERWKLDDRLRDIPGLILREHDAAKRGTEGLPTVTINFDRLGDRAYREKTLPVLAMEMRLSDETTVSNVRAFESYCDEWYRKKPVRIGRMSLGEDAVVPPEDVEALWREQLAEVIAAQGYKP